MWQLLVDFKTRSTAFKFTTNNATEMLASWERRVLKDWSDWLCLTCGKKESDPQSPAPFDGLSKDLRSCECFSFWKTIHSGFSKLRSRMMWSRWQNLQASLWVTFFLQEIIKFFKMMKTYHDEAPEYLSDTGSHDKGSSSESRMVIFAPWRLANCPGTQQQTTVNQAELE